MKPCPPGKVRNPATNRCVKADGAVGRKLKQQQQQQQTKKKQPPELNMDVVRDIMGFIRPSEAEKRLSCGKFISIMQKRYGKLDGVLKELRYSVVKTLEEFKQRLNDTHYVKQSAIQTAGAGVTEPLRDRVKLAIAAAKKENSAKNLVNICKLVVDWKGEARLIVDQIRALIHRLDVYIRTGNRPALFMQNLIVGKGLSSLHYLDNPNPVGWDLGLELPHHEHASLKKDRRNFSKRLEKDEAALPRLLAPITLS